MPLEIMDQRDVCMSSRFFEEIHFPSERQVGFWKPNAMPDPHGMDGIVRTAGRKSVASSPLEKLLPIGGLSVDYFKLPQSHVVRDQTEKLHIDEGGTGILSGAAWRYINPKTWSNLYSQSASYSVDGKRTNINGIQHESSLFSSSLSDVFTRNLKLSANDVLFDQSANKAVSCHEVEEPFESTEEIEVQTIGNLLPDGDDLFSGMIDELGYTAHANGSGDVEDFDLFSSGGGMELEGDNHTYTGQRNSDSIEGIFIGQGSSNGSLASEHPYGEHPSRTLFVRNINSNVEDSELRVLFERYGDIRSLYTACKHRGFVMISYYDIRAAANAMRALQNKPLRNRKLDIHYSIPKDNPSEKDINHGTLVVFILDTFVSNDELRQIFGIYGEIKEIHEVPHKHHHKFIEFYDIRAAEAAFRSLNRSDIVGKQFKLELSRPWGARQCLMQQSSPELVQDDLSLCQSNDHSSSEHIVSPAGITPSCRDDGSIQGLHSASEVSISAFIENAFHQGSFSVPNNLPSPVRVASVCNQLGLCEPAHPLNQVKLGNQCITSFHRHSLPDYHDGSASVTRYNSSSTVAAMASDIGSRMIEGINDRHIRIMDSNVQPMELSGAVFGSSGNGSFPLHGHHDVWSSSNSFQHHSPSPMICPNSPSFVNSFHSCCPPQLPGISATPPYMLNTVSPAHHIGSAPAVNPSLWDRRQASRVESPETSGFHLGSLGSVGFPGNSLLHSSEVASHNIFSHIGGNCMDMSTNAALRSPQMCHIFPERNKAVTSMRTSFGSPIERMRNLSHRRNEDKKQYGLDIDRILRGEDSRTTLMIKNIPNKYTSKMLLAAIDEQNRGTYDFIYLPIDFKNKCNVGYAFINMIDPLQIVPFHKAFNGKKWEKFNSEKVASLAYARIQGKAALIAHFQNSSLMNEDKRCRPILFHTDGPNAGDQEPFPMGNNVRSRPNKPRSSVNEENDYQASPSTSVQGEESSNRTDSSSGLM